MNGCEVGLEGNAMAKDCPVCELVSPDNTDTCDCGYSFARAGTVGQLQLRTAARRNMVVGGFVCFAGLAVTLLTIAASSFSGVYVIAWGAIVFGGAQCGRGLLQARRQRKLGR
jgi:hypothetical protein